MIPFLALVAFFGPATALPSHTSVLSVSQSTWDAFNASVSGRLHNGEPMLAPCYTVYNGATQIPDTNTCDVLQNNRDDHLFESNYFGAYIETNWGGCQRTGESCSFGATEPDLVTPMTRPCSQGSVPVKYVDARGVEDIQKTLLFASKNNLRLVIKNTGHDYLGRSSAPDSFALWTHNIQPPIELTRGFIPEGCSGEVGDVITFGAGQQFSKIYEFANAHDYLVVGGTCESVGAAGGWITGAGHSILSNELGLGVDNVQQLKAVLPDGTYITANRCQNQDVFFALRGGGGGTFGVVVEMSTLVHPKRPVQYAQASLPNVGLDTISEFLAVVVANSARWASEGWGGFIQLRTEEAGYVVFGMVNSLLDLSEAEDSMRPITEFVKRSGTLGNSSVQTSDFYDVLNGYSQGLELSTYPGSAWTASSRIIGADCFSEDEVKQQDLVSLVVDLFKESRHDAETLSSSIITIAVVTPFYYTRNTMPESDHFGQPGAPSVTPAWRDGLWHLMYMRQFDGRTTDPKLVRRIWQLTHDAMNSLREFTPNSGAYQNEADPFEPDPIGSFWGQENYNRLLQIKQQIDPNNLLTVHNGVGSDETDERYRCYPDVS